MAQKYLRKTKLSTEQDDDEAALGRLEAAISLDPDEESPMDLIQVYEDIGDIYFKLERNGDFEPFPNNPPAHSTTQKDKPVYSCSTGKNLKEQFGLIHSVLTAEKVQIQSDDDLARSTQSMSSEDEGEDESSRNDGRLGSSTEMYLKAIELSNKAFTRQTCLNWQRLNVRINCKLARNFQEIQDYNQTLVYLEVALAICEKTSHHFLESKLPSLYYCYAHIHLLNNDVENAWLFYNVTFELAIKVDKHLAILAMYELGKILTLVKAESRARKYFEEALKMALNYLGTLHVLTGLIYESLGLQLKKHNDLTNTMIVLEKARDIFRIVLGDDHEYTNRLRVSLNDAVTRRKKSTIYID